MAESLEVARFNRLEDFVALAKEGKEVRAEIQLKKRQVSQSVHPGETEEMKGEIEMYLLIGDYTFKVGKDVGRVSKIYVFGSMGESMTAAKENRNIANERLKMDFRRLREAKVTFEERFF